LLSGASGNGGAHFFGLEMKARTPIGKPQPLSEPKRRLKGTRKQRITKLLREVERRLDFTSNKVTLADFIRLTQLERELEEEEQPREIIVTWIDPAEKRCRLE
jgi:hypothetical protein